MTNLLDLPLDQFRGYLAEGNYPQARQDELMRAYRAQNSLSGLLDRYGEEGLEGKNVSTFFPVAGPGGMSIFDALKSGQLQTRFKDYASDALGGVLGALGNPRAAYQGTLPQADYDSAAMGTAGLAMGGGGVVAGRLPDGAVAANIPVGSKVYRQDSLKPNYAGEGAVYYTPDKTYTENYASDGRVLKTATVPDSIVDTYTDFGRAKALNWIKGQYDEYLKLSTSGELTRITPELKYISKILDKETTSAQDIAQAMANLNLIYGRQTGKNNSSAAEKRFLEAVDADAITGWESNGVPSIAFRNAPAANASKSAGLLAASLPEPRKAQNAASKLSEQFGVDFDVSNHPTSYGNSTYVSGRIAGPDGTYTDVGFRLSDHETGDKRKATDDFLTIIDGDDVSAESLVAEVQSQFDRALPKMQEMSDGRKTKATAQADALSRWSELSGDERGEIAVKFKEIRPGYANGVPWKNLTKQQRADFAAREGLLAASSPNLMQRGLLQ